MRITSMTNKIISERIVSIGKARKIIVLFAISSGLNIPYEIVQHQFKCEFVERVEKRKGKKYV